MLLFALTAYSQKGKTVKGVLQDSTKSSIIAATIKLVSTTDTLSAASNADGSFSFENIHSNSFTLIVNSLGYETLFKPVTFEKEKTVLDIGTLIMKQGSQLLNEVTIDGTPLITVKEDTLEYKVKDYNLKEDAVTEDLLKKLDGVEVDKDGNVKAQGEDIKRVRINGKDFFGGDVKTATKNLPAEVIEKIQIIDDYGDQANLTGNRSGDPERILNIQIAPEKNNGNFGTFRMGGGSEERYQATGMYNSFTDTRQLSVLGNLNNTNASLFDFNTRGSGARRGRRGGGGGGRGWNPNGLTNVGSLGLNYRKSFLDEKLTTYGNYSYSHTDNNTLSNSLNQYNYTDSTIINSQNSDKGTLEENHRFDWNVEYKPNDRSYLKISPTFSLNDNKGSLLESEEYQTNEELTNVVARNNTNNSLSPDIGISGLFNQRLNESGRNIFMDFSLNTAKTQQDRDEIVNTLLYSSENPDSLYQRQLIDLDNKRLNGGASISYTEPLNERAKLEFSYNFNFANYDNDRVARDVNEDGGSTINQANSNVYNYSFNTNRFSLTYRYQTGKLNYYLGASAQPSLLKGNTQLDGEPITFQRKAINFAPVARFEYKFSRTKGLNITYNGDANEPGFSQLQPIRDISNPQFPITGNPNLDAEFSHNIRLRFNDFNSQTGTSFFVYLNGTLTEDKIVSNRIKSFSDLYGLVQETQYLNTDGFYSMRGFYNYSKSFLKRKYVVSVNGSINYNNNLSFVDSEKNIAKNWVLSQGLNLQINPKEWLEIMPGLRYSFNTTQNSLANTNLRNIKTWSYNMNSKVYFIPTLVWGLDLSKMTNNGYSNDVDANPFVIDSYIEKQFLKSNRGAIRLHAFDLLNEQVNISRNVTENSILDSRSNRLARYFMLSLTYRFQKFATNATPPPSEQREWGGPPRHRNF